jgi:hypothetical protein
VVQLLTTQEVVVVAVMSMVVMLVILHQEEMVEEVTDLLLQVDQLKQVQMEQLIMVAVVVEGIQKLEVEVLQVVVLV